MKISKKMFEIDDYLDGIEINNLIIPDERSMRRSWRRRHSC